jgi:hypothetical protein
MIYDDNNRFVCEDEVSFNFGDKVLYMKKVGNDFWFNVFGDTELYEGNSIREASIALDFDINYLKRITFLDNVSFFETLINYEIDFLDYFNKIFTFITFGNKELSQIFTFCYGNNQNIISPNDINLNLYAQENYGERDSQNLTMIIWFFTLTSDFDKYFFKYLEYKYNMSEDKFTLMNNIFDSEIKQQFTYNDGILQVKNNFEITDGSKNLSFYPDHIEYYIDDGDTYEVVAVVNYDNIQPIRHVLGFDLENFLNLNKLTSNVNLLANGILICLAYHVNLSSFLIYIQKLDEKLLNLFLEVYIMKLGRFYFDESKIFSARFTVKNFVAITENSNGIINKQKYEFIDENQYPFLFKFTGFAGKYDELRQKVLLYITLCYIKEVDNSLSSLPFLLVIFEKYNSYLQLKAFYSLIQKMNSEDLIANQNVYNFLLKITK